MTWSSPARLSADLNGGEPRLIGVPGRRPAERIITGVARLSADQLRALRRRFPAVAASHLSPSGWTLVAATERASGPLFARFERPLRDELVATVQFEERGVALAAGGAAGAVVHQLTSDGRIAKGPLPVRVGVVAGVWYPALAKVLELTASGQAAGLLRELGELIEPPRDATGLLGRAEDLDRVAASLAELIERWAVPFIEAHGTVDALVASFRSGDEAERAELVSATLAAAGRFDEAREALGGCVASGEASAGDRERRRFVRQLTRLADSGGDLTEAPPDPMAGRSMAEPRGFAEIRLETRRRHEAIEAVRRAGHFDRAERRRLLEAEVAERGLFESPLWFERTLDALEATGGPGGRVRGYLQASKGAADSLRRLRKGLSAEPDPPTPAWLEPPDRAGFPVLARSGAWVAVRLDAAAAPLLSRAHAAGSRRAGGTVMVDAWLDWARDPASDGARLVVHLGAERVGVLDGEDAARLAAVMEAAAGRDELPRLSSRLTSLAGRDSYLLELPVPRLGTT